MKKIVACLVASILMMSFIAAPAFAAGKLIVVQENFIVVPYISYHAGYVYAEVKNTGDKPVEFNGGLLELYDAEGNSIESTNYLSCYPEILDAGETGYLYAYQSVEEATDRSFIDDYLLTVTGKGSKDKGKVSFATSNARHEMIEESYWSYNYLIADVENTTDTIYYDYYIVFAVKDAGGNILYVESCNPSYIGLKPGLSVEVRVDIDSDVFKYFEENNIVPASVEALAYVNLD